MGGNRQVRHESCLPALACDEPRLLIYGTNPAASFIPMNLHVYCIFNPFRPGAFTMRTGYCLHTLVQRVDTEAVEQ